MTVAAADNVARIYRFRGFKDMWVGGTVESGITPTTCAFTNSSTITINDNSTASPYPQTLTVACSILTNPITHITVVIDTLNHNFPDDIDMLLVAPFGTNIVLMSDCGGGNDLVNVVLLFTDTATVDLPDSTQITTGVYKPTNYGAGDFFNGPAPTGSRTTTFADFLGRDPNGVWSLYVIDDQGGDAGTIVNGFYIIFSD